MPEKKDGKQPENELDIDVKEDTIVILGRIDCPKLTHCRILISKILDKINSKKMQTHFVTCFETQFEFLRNYLLKQNLGFIDFPNSPIIYIQEVSGAKKIIGSLSEFQKYIIKEFNYHMFISNLISKAMKTTKIIKSFSNYLIKIYH